MPDDNELLPGRTLSSVEHRPDERQAGLREAAQAVVDDGWSHHEYFVYVGYHEWAALRAALADTPAADPPLVAAKLAAQERLDVKRLAEALYRAGLPVPKHRGSAEWYAELAEGTAREYRAATPSAQDEGRLKAEARRGGIRCVTEGHWPWRSASCPTCQLLGDLQRAATPSAQDEETP